MYFFVSSTIIFVGNVRCQCVGQEGGDDWGSDGDDGGNGDDKMIWVIIGPELINDQSVKDNMFNCVVPKSAGSYASNNINFNSIFFTIAEKKNMIKSFLLV